MITTYRLVQLIEEDAAEMASGLANKIERDPGAWPGRLLRSLLAPSVYNRQSQL